MSKRYPMNVTLHVHITDGEQVGSVNYGFGFGRFPTDDDMKTVLEKVRAVLPEGFRLMNRAESTMHYLREEKGYRGPNLIIPRDGEWHDPETDVDYSDLNNEPEEDYEQ